MVHSDKIRADFAHRLNQSMSMAGWPEHGKGARLAKVTKTTPKAASKWINGESIPRREKMVVIAKALAVDPIWLEHGAIEAAETICGVQESKSSYTITIEEDKLKSLIKLLKKHYSESRIDEHDLETIQIMCDALAKKRDR